ncbi:hypothetical protein CJF30_00002819 [Rutstroemia sp. NJR-2017a BBW]|nr:hypothetical protein CJF30_00002819 [Rutstroemia sp. NJR-2017a BBW]
MRYKRSKSRGSPVVVCSPARDRDVVDRPMPAFLIQAKPHKTGCGERSGSALGRKGLYRKRAGLGPLVRDWPTAADPSWNDIGERVRVMCSSSSTILED